ncbi:hypothetical protein LBMAG49_05940 [Planctomycetota bacterium]|nr:hypothetical protein LBMAG49_05940 [Planctomycetota bacterium]
MSDPSNPGSGAIAPTIVEDLFLTDAFMIKGRLENKNKRLTNVLEDHNRSFLRVQDATMISLRSPEVIRTATVLINTSEVLFAHELLDLGSDPAMRRIATKGQNIKARAFYNGALQFELAGMMEQGAYETQPTGRKYFIMQQPVLRGLDLSHPELALLSRLDYAIVRKDRLAYLFDFG